jgi:hypothetical protein
MPATLLPSARDKNTSDEPEPVRFEQDSHVMPGELMSDDRIVLQPSKNINRTRFAKKWISTVDADFHEPMIGSRIRQ